MIAEHHDPAARAKQIHGVLQSRRQHFQFAVHVDAQGLKDADFALQRFPAARAGHAFDHAGKLGSGSQWLFHAFLHDLRRDPAGVQLFAVVFENPGQFSLRELVHGVGSGIVLPAVHAHVQRRVAVDTETACLLIQLM